MFTDYEAAGEIDCDASLDVDEGWVLSGMHRPSFPTMSIVTASLPSNGDYSSFIKSGKHYTIVSVSISHLGIEL